MPASDMDSAKLDGAAGLSELPDLSDWDCRPRTQMIPESAIASPLLAAATKNLATFVPCGGGGNLAADPHS